MLLFIFKMPAIRNAGGLQRLAFVIVFVACFVGRCHSALILTGRGVLSPCRNVTAVLLFLWFHTV
jgi:hypothetical protein